MSDIVIYGRPATKKNSSRIAMIHNKPRLLPSKAYLNYRKSALEQLQSYHLLHSYNGPISMCCLYYMENWAHWPDLVGLLQATSDILQDAGIISDDMYIATYEGSKIVGIDNEAPRVEITITPADDDSILHDLQRRRLDTAKKATQTSTSKARGKVKALRPASISYLEYRKLKKGITRI